MTVLFLVSDIFGRTKALEAFSERLSGIAPDIRIIDPYQGIDHGFETEAHAYDYFINQVGLETYEAILMDHLASSGPEMVLIGFSAGASAIWAVSDQPVFKQAKKAFCFYGSQIRHNIGIQPLFDMEFIFPKQEPHFNVDELIRNLNTKHRVTCSKAPGLHGFMNKLSPHFDPVCYEKFISYLKTSLIQ